MTAYTKVLTRSMHDRSWVNLFMKPLFSEECERIHSGLLTLSLIYVLRSFTPMSIDKRSYAESKSV